MAKKIKIEIIDFDKLEYKICEDAQNGDYFSLLDDNDKIIKKIRELIDTEKNKYLNEEIKKQWEDSFKNSETYLELLSFKIKYEELVKNQQDDYKRLNEKIGIEYKMQNEIQLKTKDTKILDLIEKNKNLEQEVSKKIEDAQKININKIETLEELIKNNEEKHKLEIDNTILQTEKKWQNIINLMKENFSEEEEKLKEEINRLKREKSANSKLIGEDLENWIKSEYEQNFSFINDSFFIKDNNTIENTKADFLFEVKDTENDISLGKVVIEAKSQSELGNIKNEKYFAKLEKDRKNKGGDFSLLISELEPNDTFLIKKVNDEKYKNMFIVRPQYFLSFLHLARFVFLQKKKIINKEMNFKTKEEILKEFDSMKDNILNNSLKNLNNNSEEMLKQIDNMQKAINSMKEIVENKMIRNINIIKNKIEDFGIKKIIKKIEKVEEKND